MMNPGKLQCTMSVQNNIYFPPALVQSGSRQQAAARIISQPPGRRGESEKMNKYECFKIGDYNTRLILTTEKEYKPGDIYIDEYKDETHHFIYGKYIIMERY